MEVWKFILEIAALVLFSCGITVSDYIMRNDHFVVSFIIRTVAFCLMAIYIGLVRKGTL